MDFDFKTFSTRSFERLSQSLALHILGHGVLVFGDGPDGGREAVYEGRLNFPSPADNWSGYTIMQAKFLQVPGSPYEDADWLVGQLRTELNKFVKPDSKLRKPDYYILVSNARLSPMPEGERGKGGIAKIDEVFSEYKESLGLKDFRVWHLDQLCTMLMGAEGIRRSYAAWLSTSDIIADILADIHSRSADIHEAMYRYLARELRSHQPIRLQQAGHSGSSQTMIEDVFTDLPFRLPHQIENADGAENLLLANLLERSRDCLDSASVTAQQVGEVGRPERILLLGGPGQGKSTLSQFLAQILRANMLHFDRSGKFPADIRSIVDSTLRQAGAMGISTEVPLRFPFRVDLPSFADWLTKCDDPEAFSLLHYMARHVSTVSAAEISAGDLRTWITKFPAILILDGLDEVPSSANRDIVIKSINELWDDAANSDLLMIVTTRPQGYNDDLDPVFYSKLELVPLSTAQAIEYAKKLATALIVDPDQSERVLERLVEAAEGKTTARLLVSPLQVAIMLSLIDQRGDAPTDRWSLFDKYFAVMLQREQSKVGLVGQTMRHWGRQIAAIHYKAGFLLHVEAETPGHTEPHLSLAELKFLVRGQLSDDGFEGAELEQSTLALINVSTERMVLIVQRAEDRFNFEVRSLQEFMAAAHIMAGREVVVQKRLNAIANKAHWLHVFQIAASKCFAMKDSEQYRDTIVMICRGVNDNGSEVDRLLKSGSSLAIALLDDGIAYDQPKYRRLLLSTAFEILHSGAHLLTTSLSQHCDREPHRTAELIRGYIDSSYLDTVNAAWKLIFHCCRMRQEWAEEFIEEIWIEDSTHLAKLLISDVTLPKSSPLMIKMQDVLQRVSFPLIKSTFDIAANRMGAFGKRAILANHPCLRILTNTRMGRCSVKLKLNDVESGFLIDYTSLEISDELNLMYQKIPLADSWASVRSLQRFHVAPSASSLADFFDEMVDKKWRLMFLDMTQSLPWPCSTLLMMCETDDDLKCVCVELREGKYGDSDDWKSAEERWNAIGVTDLDFNINNQGKFFDGNIGSSGWPLSALIYSGDAPSAAFVSDIALYAELATGAPKAQLKEYIDVSMAGEAEPKVLDHELAKLMIGRRFPGVPEELWLDPKLVAQTPVSILQDPELLERINESGLGGWVWLPHYSFISNDVFEFLILNSKKYPGMLAVLVTLVAGNKSDGRFELHSKLKGLALCSDVDGPVSGCLDILNFVVGAGELSSIESAIKSCDFDNDDLPSWVLKLFLDEGCLDSNMKPQVMEGVSRVFNQNPKLSKQMYISEIKRFANGVRADLHSWECWQELEFGASLYSLGEARRSAERSV
ncbi:hypothetical protein QCD79_00355 [Pseudomonas quasicaspiana]|nr:hypothetical protein [Pseudomonas quasicaspiana]